MKMMDEEPEELQQTRPLLSSDEEAVVDHGNSSLHTHFEQAELEGHRAVHMVLHVPLDREGRKKHRHRRHHHHHHRRRERDPEDAEVETVTDTPSQRVHFILGTEDEDDEHNPHSLFIQLDEMFSKHIDKEGEWRETARWLKFEEDVEDGGERWSKPHVSTLPLHSLNLLRSYIQTNTVLLDMRADNMSQITDLVLDSMVSSGHLDESLRDRVSEALTRRHHHQSEKKLSHRIPLVRSLADMGKKHSDPLLLDKNGLLTSPNSAPGQMDLNKTTGANSRENSSLDFTKMDMHFMKKIPPGAETCNVLVGQLDFLEKTISAFVRLTSAVMLSGLTEVPVPTRFLFLLLCPSGEGAQCHEVGRSIATIMIDEVFHDVAYKARDRTDLLSGIDEFLDSVLVLPPGEWDPAIRIVPPTNVPSQMKRKMPAVPNGCPPVSDGAKESEHQPGPELQRTGRLFGGLVCDVKRKLPFFWSDFRDSLSLQCLASVLFLYCACMSPVITFGGLLGEATKGNISAIESLFGASLTGITYSLFSGQPLTILGSTGPILVFEKILFKFCTDYSLDYLSFRTCIGLWTSFFCLVLVASDASTLVCYITRFTEEAFAALICIIFIYEALEKLLHLGTVYPYQQHPHLDNLTHYRCECFAPENVSSEFQELWTKENLTTNSITWNQLGVKDCSRLGGVFEGSACGPNGPYVPDVLFWSIILFFSTFILSSFLKQFKTKRCFPTKIRASISDFSVFLTILFMVLIDYLIGVQTPKLRVPDRFQPTSPHRGWIISPIGPNPWWSVLAAAVPALLCTILIFMDQQITAVIINRKENKLKKGCGYHLDLLMVALMLCVCSVMGLPWFVAATVLSITHVNSLRQESECSAPGEMPKFLGIREQRVTGFLIFSLMGCSVFMTSILKFIPMPVLYGVFLYMGVSSLKGIQMYDRLKLFLMPSKHQPDLIYLRYVPLWKVHVFTLVQLLCLVALWVIKASAAAVVFPMMVLALVFIRKLLDFFFTKKDLSWLDDLIPENKKKKEDDKKKERESLRRLDETEEETHRPQISLKQRFGEKVPPVQIRVENELGHSSLVASETSF